MTVEEMIARIKWLLRLNDGTWAAQAVGGACLIKGATARDAMRNAYGLAAEEPQQEPNEDLF